MKFAKPPVIELWFEFQFGLGEVAPDWNLAKAKELIEKCFGERFSAEAYRNQIQFLLHNIEGEEQATPEIKFDRIRATTKEKDRYVQAGKDMLVYNVVRTQDRWPEYDNVKVEAIEALCKYQNFMKHNRLESAALHYRDIVKIPLDADGKIRPEDYLRIFPQSPDEEWATNSGFSIHMTLPYLREEASIRLEIVTEANMVETNEKGDKYGIFRMDWHATSNIKLEVGEVLKNWMDNAHKGLLKAFENTFTEKGLALFEPEV